MRSNLPSSYTSLEQDDATILLMESPDSEPCIMKENGEEQKIADIEYHRRAAASYDAQITRHFHFFHVYSLHRWARNLIARKSDVRVADLGTGTGVVACTLASFGCKVWAVDHSPEMLAIAKSRAYSQGVKEKIYFEQGDCDHLPYPDAMFDAVTIQGVLHHLPDPTMSIREAHRILKPGGELYISEPCREGTMIGHIINCMATPVRWIKRQLSSGGAPGMVSEDEHSLSGPELVEMTQAIGFETEVEYLLNMGLVKYFPQSWRIWLTLAASWPTRRSRGDLIFLIGRKK